MGALVEAAFQRYRFMSFVTGSMLLVLTAVLINRGVDHHLYLQMHVFNAIVGISHGMVFYPIYLVTCFMLFLKARFSYWQLVLILLAGWIPGLAFYMEARMSRQLRPLWETS